MRLPNPILETEILEAALELMQDKDPSQIGMREVAKKCGISATSIYNYYKDKNQLLIRISITCLTELKDKMTARVSKVDGKKEKVREALAAYRDWCFEKPKTALLVFTKLEEEINDELIMNFYICNRMGEILLEDCAAENILKVEDIKLNTGIAISGLWGCIESIITKRSDPIYWNKGKEFTDRFIDIMMETYFGK